MPRDPQHSQFDETFEILKIKIRRCRTMVNISFLITKHQRLSTVLSLTVVINHLLFIHAL